MNLPFPVALSVEKAIEAVLKLDPETRRRLHSIDGSVIRFVIDAPAVSLMLTFSEGNVFVLRDDDAQSDVQTADTTISGSLSALLSLLKGNDAIYEGGVRIEGDIGLSQSIREIIEKLDPDWQDALSPLIGDSLTHRLDVLQIRFAQWIKRSGRAARENTSEYLQEEIQVLAPDSEIALFCEDVDELRAAADRLEAKISRLESNKACARDEV